MEVGPDWAHRAATVERTVIARYLRHVGGWLPGTCLGRVRWPRPFPERPSPWNYWWQAHVLDCLLDAQCRAPSTRRAALIRAVRRGIWVRNLGRWTNRYYDDIAWLGLALERANRLAGLNSGTALQAITERLRSGWSEAAGGGIHWRTGDDYKNAPANGPAAILLARVGQVHEAARITDWMTDTLVDRRTGLVRDGVWTDPLGRIRAVNTTIYTYCAGVYLGACVELAARDRDPRWTRRAQAVLGAIGSEMADPDGVIIGGGTGDGGLFNGILARYLAVAALRRPELAPQARRILLASATAAWDGRAEVPGGPVFARDWRRPARAPAPGMPEADLSVQLSAWMVTEAAAVVSRAGWGSWRSRWEW